VDDLTRWRSQFPILEETIYMISNSLGAMPKGAARGLAEYAATWATRGVRAWEERWWNMPREVGDSIGAIIGAPSGSVSMHENVTTAHMVVLSCFRPTASRRKVVCLGADFPSLIYLFREQTAFGYELEIVPMEPDLTVNVDRLLASIDSSTLLVAMSHVFFRTSLVMDPVPVVARAREVGAHVVLDVYQSAGIYPLDVGALEVDFAIGGCLKWLCGGPGNAFLYARPELFGTLRPAFTGWLAHREPFRFSTEGLERRSDAMGMMNGTPSIPAYHAALAGLEVIREVGVREDQGEVAVTDPTDAGAGGPARFSFCDAARCGSPGRDRCC
jgi:kynureninase